MGRPGNEIDRERHRTLRRREKEGEGTEEVCIYIYRIRNEAKKRTK